MTRRREMFVRTALGSLTHARGFGAYGCDRRDGDAARPAFRCMLVTPTAWEAGAVVAAHLCGVFYRRDGDHKLVALDDVLHQAVPDP